MTDHDRVLVWIRVGVGVKVCALAMAAPEARADPGPSYVTPDELATLRLSPHWPARESRGEIVVIEASGPQWSDLDEADLLDQVRAAGDNNNVPVLAFLRDQEHRCGDPHPRLLAAIYDTLADIYWSSDLDRKSRRARAKAKRWHALIDGPSQSSAK